MNQLNTRNGWLGRQAINWLVLGLFAVLGLSAWQTSAQSDDLLAQGQETDYNGFELPELLTPQIGLAEVTEDQHVIYIGMHVDKVYELSLQSRTFSADGYIWIEWSSDTQDVMDRQGIGPADLIRLVNQIESWDSTFELDTPQPTLLSAGRRYQRFRFSSRFYDDEVNFERDPFDVLILPIIVEINPDQMSDKYEQALLFGHHHQNGFLGLSGGLSGYELKGAALRSFLHRYPSRFGSWYQPTKSQARLDIVYQSDYWSAFVNWVLPLVIIMSVVLMAPTVAGSLGDIRLAVPSTALLTLVFLHQAYHDDIPSLPYLTFLDQLFACGYLIAMGLFALFTWGTNIYAKSPEELKGEATRRIDRVDLFFQVSSIAMFLGVAVISWLRTSAQML